MSRNKNAKEGARRRDAKNTCKSCDVPLEKGTPGKEDRFGNIPHYNESGSRVAHYVNHDDSPEYSGMSCVGCADAEINEQETDEYEADAQLDYEKELFRTAGHTW